MARVDEVIPQRHRTGGGRLAHGLKHALAIDGREVQYPAKPATVIMDDCANEDGAEAVMYAGN